MEGFGGDNEVSTGMALVASAFIMLSLLLVNPPIILTIIATVVFSIICIFVVATLGKVVDKFLERKLR